jgi:hypothetical protein
MNIYRSKTSLCGKPPLLHQIHLKKHTPRMQGKNSTKTKKIKITIKIGVKQFQNSYLRQQFQKVS